MKFRAPRSSLLQTETSRLVPPRWGLLLVLGIAVLALSPGCDSGSSRPAPAKGEPPRIEIVFPDRGAPDGGQSVSIYTTGFEGDFEKETPEVHFGNSRAKVVPFSSFSLVVETPPGVEGPVDIRIENGATSETAVLAGGFSYDEASERLEPAGLSTLEGAPPATMPGVPAVSGDDR